MLNPPNYKNIINNIKEKCPNLKDADLCPRFDTFIQMWGSTCLEFDVDDNGDPMIGGQMMTEAYTTVCELGNEIYVVCFNEEPCYVVKSPTSKFYEDLKNRSIASRSRANKEY